MGYYENEIKFRILGKPGHRRRHRSTNRGGFVRQYKDPGDASEELTIQAVAQLYAPAEVFKGPVAAHLVCYFPIPKSQSKKNRELMKQGIIRPTVKPDGDNIEKLYFDALEGIIYENDKQIVEQSITRWYGEKPMVEVCIAEINTQMVVSAVVQ